MKRLATLAVIALASLAGCSNPPSKGYVYSINYNPPSSIWWPGHYVSGSCYGTGSRRSCTAGYWDPGWWQYFPAEWQLQLCAKPGKPTSSNACGWRDVDEQTWHSVRLGQYYTTEAS